MKTSLLVFIGSCGIASFSLAQTNVFPSSGNVGIGTAAPAAPLDVEGWGVRVINGNGNATQLDLVQTTGGHDWALVSWGSSPAGGGLAAAFSIYDNTSGGHRFLINSQGYVGIGTTSPLSKLVVTGDGGPLTEVLRVERGAENLARLSLGHEFIQRVDGNGNYNTLLLNPNGGHIVTGATAANNPGGFTKMLQVAVAGSPTVSLRDTSGTPQQFDIAVNSKDLDIYNATSGTHPMVIKGASGNVGIGTVAPASRLHIVAGSDQSVAIYTPAYASGIADFSVGGAGWQFGRPGDGAFAHAIYTYNTSAGAKNNLALSSRSDIVFTAGNSGPPGAPERMRIAESGNVGIGTSNPTQKLSVNGSIRAKEVIVETVGWPDYVFADDYNLKPLSEVEHHIKQHKRLPGIPSASEVAEKGVGVGEMQAKLLAKVEELTLHLIDLKKENESLKARVNALESK